VHPSASCVAVIPCWNEADTIGPLVREVRAQVPAVIVVDDGSRDATAGLAREAGAAIAQHAVNRGKGAALQTGLAMARARGFAWAVTLDGDGQHRPADIAAFLARAAVTAADLVVGNRMADSAQMPWSRRAANRWMSRQLSRRAGRSLPDSQCGFRLFRLEAWAALRITSEHFEVESETILAFALAGRRIEFVPVPVVASPRPSRIQPVLDTLRWLRWWRRWAGRDPRERWVEEGLAPIRSETGTTPVPQPTRAAHAA
jgi:glycosyltransferase involved in cell wall biosynthesis